LDGVDWAWFTTRPRPKGEVLPWDHLSVGLNRNWLWREYSQAIFGGTLGDCRWDGCELCGVCTAFDTDIELAADPGFVSGRPLTRTKQPRHPVDGAPSRHPARSEAESQDLPKPVAHA